MQTAETKPMLAAWLAASFLIILGAQLWIVQLYGSPLPLWDQWFEANDFFKPWANGHLRWTDFFASLNGHRILSNRVLDVCLIWLNGRWEPMLQMAVNAGVHAAYACGLALALWHFLGRRNGWFICLLLLPFFALPYGGENTIWGITPEYFLDSFMLLTLLALGFAQPLSGWWWGGLAAAMVGVFTMATGVLAPLAVAGLAILRAIRSRKFEKGILINLLVCLAIVGAGLALNTAAKEGQELKAHNLTEFFSAFVKDLTWLFFDHPLISWLALTPLVLLLFFYFRPNFPAASGAEFLLALGLWSGLQAASLAFGRANYGGDFPVSRYLDIVNVHYIASLFALLLLVQWRWNTAKWHLLPPLLLAGVMGLGLYRISTVVTEQLLLPTRMMNLVAEERVEKFLASGDERDLFEQPTVRPDPRVTLSVLRDAKLQAILPASCLAPGKSVSPDRLKRPVEFVLRNAPVMLGGGLLLFAVFCGIGLARGALGVPREDVVGVIALLTALTACGFVWSRSQLTRRNVEYGLQVHLADYFQSNHNPQRAAVHAAKAEKLKP